MEQASKGMRSLGRLGKTDDIANIIVWLLDPEHSWVAGQVFGVDEGLSAILPRVKS
jgi:3-oxoacyl-[acyl-carrier protein] reductase